VILLHLIYVSMVRNLDLSRGQKKVVDLREKGRTISIKSKPRTMTIPQNIKPLKRGHSKMKRVSNKKSKKLFYTFFFLILIILLVTVFNIYFSNKGSFSSESIMVTLNSPKSVASGEEVTLTLNYENIDKVALKDMEVVIQYPEGFFFNKATYEPISHERNVWQLPSLGPGESNALEVTGQLMGKKNDNKEFNVTLYYMPVNFNSTFKADLNTAIKINDVLFEVELIAPSDIIKGEEVEFQVNYTNTTAQVMENIHLAFLLGDNFELTEATSSTTPESIWDFEKIEAGQSGQLILKGKFNDKEKETVSYQLKIWQDLISEENVEQRYIHIEDRELFIHTYELYLNLEMLNKNDLSWGGNADFKITLENLGKAVIKDAFLTVDTNSQVIAYDKINIEDADLQIHTLVFSPEKGGFGKNLEEIREADKYEYTFSLPLISKIEDYDLISPEEVIVEAITTLSFNFATNQEKVVSDLQTGFIVIAPELTTEARYYLDYYTVVGSGPIPPVVGEETKYMIYWKVFSGPKGLRDFETKSSLPPYITYKGNSEATAGNLDYDVTTREIKWTFDEISPNTQIMASFELGVFPEGNQVNQLLILTNPTQLTAVEKVTDNPITRNNNLLTSELLGDPRVEKQGKVTVD